MRRTILAAAAVAAVLSIGAPVNKAAAMSAAAPTQLGLPSADASLVQKTAIVCGYWGCRRVVGRLLGTSTLLGGLLGAHPGLIGDGVARGDGIGRGAGAGVAGDRPIVGSHASAP